MIVCKDNVFTIDLPQKFTRDNGNLHSPSFLVLLACLLAELTILELFVSVCCACIVQPQIDANLI